MPTAIPYPMPDLRSLGALCSLFLLVGAAIYHLAALIFKNPRGRRTLRAALEDEKATDEKMKPIKATESDQLLSALLAFVQRLETSNEQDREDRGNQWAKVEKMEQAIHGLSVILAGAVQQFATSQQNLSQSVARMEQAQINLATHVYQNLRPDHRHGESRI